MIPLERKSPAGGRGLARTQSNQTGPQKQYTAGSSPLHVLLDRLDGVQKSGQGWRARCPACGGKSRKVSIAEADDGRVLMHCFAGCGALEIVQAVNLQLADLFPDRGPARTPLERRQRREAMRSHGWAAALRVLDDESLIVLLAGCDIANGMRLVPKDHERLVSALERIHSARRILA